MQSIRPNSSVGVGYVNENVMHKLQTTVDAWVGYGSKRQMAWQEPGVAVYRPSNVSAVYIGWIECRLAVAAEILRKKSHIVVSSYVSDLCPAAVGHGRMFVTLRRPTQTAV